MPRRGRPPLPSALLRNKLVVIPVSSREQRVFKRYAKLLKTHMATLTRQHLLDAAAKYGIVP